jgi:hypothetical protein
VHSRQLHPLLRATYREAEAEGAGEIIFDLVFVLGENNTLRYWLIEENSDI